MKIEITAERLRTLLRYDSDTGVFTWLISLSNKGQKGSNAGWSDKNGYTNIGIKRRTYKAHRLAWLYVYGHFPAGDIDHINGMTGDNRIANLRSVSHAVNGQNIRAHRINNKTGFLGVSHSGNKFKAQIMLNGKQKNLGRYDTPEQAHQIYLTEKRIQHEGCTI